MYFNPMDVTLTDTPVRAWVETAKALRDADGFHLGGVIVHIQNPSLMNDRKIAVVQHVDSFLREHGQYPISTVANTIFGSIPTKVQKVPQELTAFRFYRHAHL